MSQASHEGFDDVFTLEYQAVLRTIFLMVGDRAAAEDATQEAFTRLYVHWRKVSRYDRPGAWVRRVAIREAGRARRRAARHEQHDDTPWNADTGLGVDVRQAIVTLPMAQRAAIVLHYFEDLPVAECAPIMGCAPATAKVHLHRARKRLGELLREEVIDDVSR